MARFGRRIDESGPRGRFRDLLPYLARHRGVLAVAIGLSLLGAVAQLAQPLLVQQIVGSVQTGTDYGWLVGIVVVLLVVSALLGGLTHYLLQRIGTSVVLTARQRLVTRMLRLPIPEFDARRTGDLVSRVGADTTLLYAVMTQGLVDAAGGVVVFVGAIIAMAVLDWVLLLLVLGVVAFAVLTVGLLSRRVRAASHRQQTQVGLLTAAVDRAIIGIRTIRAANATDRETAAVLTEAEGAYRAGLDVAKASAAIVPLAGITLQLAFLVVLGVGGFRVASGAIPIGSLIAFVLFLFLLVLPLGNAFGAISSLNQALGAVGRIQEIIELPPEDDAPPAELGSPVDYRGPGLETGEDRDPVSRRHPSDRSSTSGGGPMIEFEDVSFAYPSGEEVLHGVSFAATRGARTAIVGPSGAGKSTMLALIERFYDPAVGTIRLDGADSRSIERAALRARIGYVEQDAPALAGTIRDNLTIGAPTAGDAECGAVLREVNLGEVHHREGLDAQVGEGGVLLSGGERQRLAIARALLAAPDLLLLDEATASLDGTNERLLRDAIDAASSGRTLIVIAHRLATVVDSERIIVLDHGRVVGTGTHAELVETTPLYRELAATQLLV